MKAPVVVAKVSPPARPSPPPPLPAPEPDPDRARMDIETNRLHRILEDQMQLEEDETERKRDFDH